MTNQLKYLEAEIANLKSQSLYNWPRTLDGANKAVCIYDGKEVINLSANNYLGLCDHPKLVERAVEYTKKYGAGPGAVRTIAGSMKIHLDLEAKIADFKHCEACLLYQSGYTANAGTSAAILDKESIVYSDQLNHASIIDGIRISGCDKGIFNHGDITHLKQLIEENKPKKHKRALLVTDGVFSMDGDIAKLPELVKVAEENNLILMIDDAHSSGVLGSHGRGTVDHYKLHGKVDIQVGTLSKAIGVLGGYVVGTRALVDWLMNRGRPILFSTSLPPAAVGAVDAAFDLLIESDELQITLWKNREYWVKGLKDAGFNIGNSATPIVPIIAGENERAVKLSRRLFEEGVFAQSIVFPTVPKGTARVRTIVTAKHAPKILDKALDVFKKVGKELGII
jgi:glycine C-acetyltransferase